MLNVLSRGYGVVHTGAMVALLALAVNYYSGVLIRSGKEISGAIQYVKTHELVLDKSKVDRALLEFNLSYDLSNSFNWSTHTLFLYVSAHYENKRHFRNEVVIYDRVITTPEEAKFEAANVMSKYYLLDLGRGLRNKRVTLRLFYEVVPIGGFLKQYQLDHDAFNMGEYTTS